MGRQAIIKVLEEGITSLDEIHCISKNVSISFSAFESRKKVSRIYLGIAKPYQWIELLAG